MIYIKLLPAISAGLGFLFIVLILPYLWYLWEEAQLQKGDKR